MAKKKLSVSAENESQQTTIFLIIIFVLIAALYFYNCYIKKQRDVSESFSNQQTCPVYNPIGPYDGITLPPSSGNVYGLMQPTRQNATVLGYQVPLQQPNPNDEVGYSESYPTVDGTPNTQKDLFMFAHNMSHPDCCPSTYSTSTGCVCTTPEQRNWISMRGKK